MKMRGNRGKFFVSFEIVEVNNHKRVNGERQWSTHLFV